MLEGDRGAFEATLHRPRSRWGRDQLASFDRFAALPLLSYDLTARWDRYGDLARAGDAVRYGGDAAAIPVTEERYRLGGDASIVVEDIFFTFVRSDGEWSIAGDEDVADLGFLSARHPWDFGPVAADARGPFHVLSHPCVDSNPCAPPPRGFEDLATSALRRGRRFWPGPWPRQVVVVLPATATELARILQATFDPSKFVAFAVSTIDTAHGWRFTGPRIFIGANALAARTRGEVVGILAHELVHVATRRSSGPFVPTFVEEGFADYAGRNADPASLSYLRGIVAAGSFDRALPADHEFTVGDQTTIYRAYQEAHSAVKFFIDRWGAERFVRFYRRLGRMRRQAGTARRHLDRSLRVTIGMGLAAFERKWAVSIAGS